MRKVYVDVSVRLVINIDEGVDIGDVINEMEYSFSDTTTNADIVDTEITGFEVTDSK